MPEMPLVLIAAQGVLDVAGNGRVHILIGAFPTGKGGSLVVVDAAETHGAAVADILVDAMDAENGLKLAVRDERGVQQDAASVELFVLSKEKSHRVRAGEYGFHAAGRKYIRKQRRALDEILHECHFIEEHIAEALRLQQLEITVYIRQRISCGNLDECNLGKFCLAHLRENLTDHGGFTRPAQTVEDKHLVLLPTVNVVVQLLEALAPAIAANRCREGTQRLSGADIRGKRRGIHRFSLGQLLLQRFQLPFQSFSLPDLSAKILQFIRRNILLPPLLVLCPAVVEIFLAVDGFLRNGTGWQISNQLFQLRRTCLHLR